MLRHAVALLVVAVLAGGAAEAGEPTRHFTNTVTYQCPNEAPKTFQYVSAHRIPFMSEAKLETQWYWQRARADRGAGCRILSVDGLTYTD
jgi:hypothetical protein